MGDSRQDGQRFTRTSAQKAEGERFPLPQAFACARNGVVHAWRTQRNMRIHTVVALLAVVLGLLLRIDAASWCAVVVCIAVVFAAECFNTAIEAVVDLTTDDYHDLARVAKDCAAGAVYVCAIGAVIVGCIVFLPPLMALLSL